MRFTLSSSPALSAPITAVATFYGLPTEEKTLANKTYFAHFAECETLVSAAPGYIATAAGFTVKAIDGPVGAGSEKGESVCGGYWVGELGAALGVHRGRGCEGSFWEDDGAGRGGGAVAFQAGLDGVKGSW